MTRFWSKVRIESPDSCWIWAAFIEDGYGMFWLNGRPQRASRVSWSLHHGVPVPPSYFVLHHCDNRACVNPRHLFLGTHEDNMLDMKMKGRAVCPAKEHPELQARGEKAGAAKLTAQAIVEIRKMSQQGLSQRNIAKQFDVDHKTIGAVLRGKTWRHV